MIAKEGSTEGLWVTLQFTKRLALEHAGFRAILTLFGAAEAEILRKFRVKRVYIEELMQYYTP